MLNSAAASNPRDTPGMSWENKTALSSLKKDLFFMIAQAIIKAGSFKYCFYRTSLTVRSEWLFCQFLPSACVRACRAERKDRQKSHFFLSPAIPD
jgi:hypothetical protein